MAQNDGGAGTCRFEEAGPERGSAVMPRAMVLLFAMACGVSVAFSAGNGLAKDWPSISTDGTGQEISGPVHMAWMPGTTRGAVRYALRKAAFSGAFSGSSSAVTESFELGSAILIAGLFMCGLSRRRIEACRAGRQKAG